MTAPLPVAAADDALEAAEAVPEPDAVEAAVEAAAELVLARASDVALRLPHW